MIDEFTLNLLCKQFETLLKIIESFNFATKSKLMEYCGRTCAQAYDALEKAKQIAQQESHIEDKIQRVNKEIPWCNEWTVNKNQIQSICEECGCSLVKAELVKLNPLFCLCSRGFIKNVFSIVLDKPVDVELRKAIGRGDKHCEFVVNISD